ncbi:hypothetical protein AB0I10_18090 [Streptomyces sp. NPDC050636]|uniref:DUF7683 domain-containing protein n=1 Tax=Streptomyces sp. NPDC050636 TaxID=3154510 RepID=UPI00343C6051
MRILVTTYRKDSDFPEDETDVSGIGVEVAASIVGIPADRFLDGYLLDESQAATLGKLTGITFDLDSYEYFLEAEAD